MAVCAKSTAQNVTPSDHSTADLPLHIAGMIGGQTGAAEPVGAGRTLDEVERRHILRILEETNGNHLRAAEILGINRRTLYRKLEKYQQSAASSAAR